MVFVTDWEIQLCSRDWLLLSVYPLASCLTTFHFLYLENGITELLNSSCNSLRALAKLSS